MKKTFACVLILICSTLILLHPIVSPWAQASDLSDNFTRKFKELEPRENSSVGSDYLFEQISLGSEYTIMLLDQLNQKNNGLNEKMDVMIDQFNTLIEQNKKIIELLEKKDQP